MGRKLTSVLVALAFVVVLIPAPRAQAIDSEIYYTVWFDCVIGPNLGPIGEWTAPCQGQMYGWGAAPNTCPGNPPHCCYTTIDYGPACE